MLNAIIKGMGQVQSRVAQKEEILEKLTSLGGLGFILGPIVPYNFVFFFLDFMIF